MKSITFHQLVSVIHNYTVDEAFRRDNLIIENKRIKDHYSLASSKLKALVRLTKHYQD